MNQLFTCAEIAGTALVTPFKTTATDVSAELSFREVEILKSVAIGLTNKEIGMRLDLSCHTVRGHLRRIYKKLSVKCRTEAVKRLYECPPPGNRFMIFNKLTGI